MERSNLRVQSVSSSVAKNVYQLSLTAALEAEDLRAKHEITTPSLLRDRDYFKEEKEIVTPLTQYLNQLSLKDLKRLHAMVQVGEQPSRLNGGRSINDVYQDLEHTLPGIGDENSYIQYLMSRAFRLHTLLSEFLCVCRKKGIDPARAFARI